MPELDPQQHLRAWLQFLRAPGMGPAKRRALFETLGSIEAVLGMSELQARALRVSTESLNALRRPDLAQIERDLAWFEYEQRHLLVLGEADYPELLARAADAPVALFASGDVARLSLPCIAMVGSRGASKQGAEFAGALARDFSASGLTVVSGMALGIDSAAHAGALIGPGSTAAVFATGLDVIYPKQNAALVRQVLEQGGVVVSEMPLGSAPLPALFPQRNRIISGLSLGVVVVEASTQSGSLVTARFAGEQGREVFAVPGSIHNPMARGCHQLIRQGAKLVESAQDVLSELGGLIGAQMQTQLAPEAPKSAKVKASTRAKQRTEPAPGLPLSAEQQSFLELLGYDPVTVDRLVELSGMSVPALTGVLLELELEGHVERLAGARYQRRN